MRRAFVAGARRAFGLWPLALVLWVVNALFAAAFGFASAYWLATAFGRSVARRTLVSDLDPDFLVDLYLHHGASFRMLLLAGAILAIAHGMLWIRLHAWIVFALRSRSYSGENGRPWTIGVERGAAFARLFVLAGVVLALFSALVGGGGWLALRWAAPSTTAWVSEAIIAAAAVIWVGGLIVLVAVHDHARIRVFAAAEGPWKAYRWAWSFVLGGGERALWLAVALQASSAAVWLGYQLIGTRLPVGEMLGITGALLWGELFLGFRVWMRIWFFAAENELQE